MLEDIEKQTRTRRIESKNNEIFKKAYLELESSVEYAKENFSDTSIYPCLKTALYKYTLRFKQLNNNP